MSSQWYITDDDCMQCANGDPHISGHEFVQINRFAGHVDGKPFYQVAHGTIHLEEYSQEEILDALNFFSYENMDALILATNPEGEFVYDAEGKIDTLLSSGYEPKVVDSLIAEMLFEIESQEFVTEEFDTWNKALTHISQITKLNLRDHYEQSDKDFVVAAKRKTGEVLLATRAELPQIAQYMDISIITPGCDPQYMACYLSKDLSDITQSITPTSYTITPAAKAQLSVLLEPIIQADIGADRHMFPIMAIRWANDHSAYMDGLDKVFHAFGLIDVERIRFSVTQGEALVRFNGEKIIQYGDDIKLHSNDRDGIFDAVCTNKPLYGPIISGWGSTKPDELFRKAALAQYGKDILRALEPNKTLDDMIRQAEGKRQQSFATETPARESER